MSEQKTIEGQPARPMSRKRAKVYLSVGWLGLLIFTLLSFYYPSGLWSVFILSFAYIAGLHHGYVSPEHFFRVSAPANEPKEGLLKFTIGTLGWVAALAILILVTAWRFPNGH